MMKRFLLHFIFTFLLLINCAVLIHAELTTFDFDLARIEGMLAMLDEISPEMVQPPEIVQSDAFHLSEKSDYLVDKSVDFDPAVQEEVEEFAPVVQGMQPEFPLDNTIAEDALAQEARKNNLIKMNAVCIILNKKQQRSADPPPDEKICSPPIHSNCSSQSEIPTPVAKHVYKNDFEHAFASFKKSNSFSEQSLQELLDLVNLEIVLVENLLAGNSGWHIERLINKRNRMLKHSVPTIVHLYNLLLDVATAYDPLGQQHTNQKKMVVTHIEKRAFLQNMHTILSEYWTKLRKSQLYLSMNDLSLR